MSKRSIIPAHMQTLYDDWHMSPGIECDGFVFLTGVNGVASDGTVSPDAAEQIETAFAHVEAVLLEGGMSFSNVIEVTSYHVGLRQHLEIFKGIWKRKVVEPYPAWTAIEVAGFASEGVVVELRVIARRNR
ncbi:MAG: Rid family hydrolase [Pseudomonadota bacterium]